MAERLPPRSTVYLHFGFTSAGTMGGLSVPTDYPILENPYEIGPADLDKDAIPDLVVGNGTDTAITGGDGTYDLYTVATDAAGNTETAPASPDVSVTFNDNSAIEEWILLNK